VTPIGFVIATMLAIVAFSYRQTIDAYPSGGGAYIVAKDNLGQLPSLIAAASLLIDYVLTVAGAWPPVSPRSRRHFPNGSGRASK